MLDHRQAEYSRPLSTCQAQNSDASPLGKMSVKEPPPEGFTERLREAMGEVNQRELARRLHVNEGTISKWFGSPAQAPSLRVLARIPRALPGTSVDWLLGVPEAQAPPKPRPRPELLRAVA